MPMRFPGLQGLLPFLREEISLLSSLLCNAWIRIQSFQPITDRSIQFANQKSYYHCDKIWEKISVSRNKIKKLICFSLLLIFVRQADTKKHPLRIIKFSADVFYCNLLIHGAESVYQFFADFQFVLTICFDDDISRCLIFSTAFLHQVCDKWNCLVVLNQRTVVIVFDTV